MKRVSSRRWVGLVAWGLCVLAAIPASTSSAARVGGPIVEVGSSVAFARAAQQLGATGGTIVLRRGHYSRLYVGPRGTRRLLVRARKGASASEVVLDGTQSVTVAGLAIRPRGRAALVSVIDSRDVVLARIALGAGGTRSTATLQVADSSRVRITDGTFSACGDRRRPRWGACVSLRGTRNVTIARSRFQDCYGCDFVAGTDNSRLTITRSTFDRALVGRCGRRIRLCHHQDLVQLVGGADLLIEHSRFGVYELGEAQVFLAGAIDGVVIRDNLFADSDPLVPGLAHRRAISLGVRRWKVGVPRHVTIVRNTILSGTYQTNGHAASIYLSPNYLLLPRRKRPALLRNTIALNETPVYVCRRLRTSSRNVVGSGAGCSRSDRVGELVVPLRHRDR